MTSTNVTQYRIEKDGKKVGNHYQHAYCKTKWHELLKFEPLEEHTITPYGEDEEECYWEREPQNLRDFLIGCNALPITKNNIKVGDRIKDTSTMSTGNATISEITERGFKFKLDTQFNAHPRLGITWAEGEAFIDDEYLQKSCHWKLIPKEKPYIEKIRTVKDLVYNPKYGDDRICECDHPYYRHFDTFGDMESTRCQYCGCGEFKEKINNK